MGDDDNSSFSIPKKYIVGAISSLMVAAIIPTVTMLLGSIATKADFADLKHGQLEHSQNQRDQASKLDGISSAIGDMRESISRHDERIRVLEGRDAKRN